MTFLRRWVKGFVRSSCSLCILGLACRQAEAQNGYYSSANALFLNVSNPDQQVVPQHLVFVDTAWLKTDDADFDFRPGMEITLGKHLDELTSIEGSYFGLHRWSASASVADPNENLNAPFSPGGFFLDDFQDAFKQGFTSTADVHNVELNLRRQLTDPIAAIFGIRYLSYSERFHFYSVDEPNPNSDVGRYNVDTQNHALGLQLGVQPTYRLLDWLEVGGIFKAGLFANWVNQDTRVINNRTTFAAGSSSATSATGMVDANLLTSVIYGNWKFSAGYRAMLMSGMARATDQLDFTINEDPRAVISNVNNNGSVILHGPWAGVTLQF